MIEYEACPSQTKITIGIDGPTPGRQHVATLYANILTFYVHIHH